MKFYFYNGSRKKRSKLGPVSLHLKKINTNHALLEDGRLKFTLTAMEKRSIKFRGIDWEDFETNFPDTSALTDLLKSSWLRLESASDKTLPALTFCSYHTETYRVGK